jgi:hypothetical protein
VTPAAPIPHEARSAEKSLASGGRFFGELRGTAANAPYHRALSERHDDLAFAAGFCCVVVDQPFAIS